jgi:exonuclease SbcD
MRLLHTSDWHLGRSFHRKDMLSAQAVFVDFLVETVRAEDVDTVLVSGDIYDRALPSVDAVELCNEALARLAATGARVVLISGNHDSATRLRFGSRLIDAAGIHLRTDPRSCGTPVLLADEHGPVAVYAIPYLEPDSVRTVLDCDEGGHGPVIAAAMRHVRADLVKRPETTRSVALAHAFVTGASTCESERDISVGGASAVAPSVFDGIDYVALGHLHGAQVVSDAMRYSGSPVAYSFSEEHHHKGMWLVDLPTQRASAPDVEFVATPVPRPLKRLRGRLDDLLADPGPGQFCDHYLQVTLTDPVRPRGAMDRLRRRFPHVLVLGFEPQDDAAEAPSSYASRLRGRSDIEVADDFVTHVRSSPEAAETELFQRAFESVRQVEANA